MKIAQATQKVSATSARQSIETVSMQRRVMKHEMAWYLQSRNLIPTADWKWIYHVEGFYSDEDPHRVEPWDTDLSIPGWAKFIRVTVEVPL